MADIADLEYQIARLELRPGDVLVVRIGAILTHDMAMRAREHFASYLPEGVKVLIVDGGAELSVLTREQLRERLGEER